MFLKFSKILTKNCEIRKLHCFVSVFIDFANFPIRRPDFRKSEGKNKKSGSTVFVSPTSTVDCAAQFFQRPSEIRGIRVAKIDFFEIFSRSHCRLHRGWIHQIRRILGDSGRFRAPDGARRRCGGRGGPGGARGSSRDRF